MKFCCICGKEILMAKTVVLCISRNGGKNELCEKCLSNINVLKNKKAATPLAASGGRSNNAFGRPCAFSPKATIGLPKRLDFFKAFWEEEEQRLK